MSGPRAADVRKLKTPIWFLAAFHMHSIRRRTAFACNFGLAPATSQVRLQPDQSAAMLSAHTMGGIKWPSHAATNTSPSRWHRTR